MTRRAALSLLVIAVFTIAFATEHKPARADTVTWTGGDASNSNWTDPQNWSPGAPVAGDVLVFPQAASRKTNTNDFPANTSFAQIVLTGSGYELNGNPLELTMWLENDPPSGTNTVNLAIGGDGGVVQEDGTLVLTGANTFDGAVNVQGGFLVVEHDTALGSFVDDTFVREGARLVLAGGLDVPEPISIEGDGGNELGALQLPGGNTTVALVALTGDAVIGVGNGTLTLGTLLHTAPDPRLALVGGGRLVVESSTFESDIEVLHGNLTWNATGDPDVLVEDDGWLRGTGAVHSIDLRGGLVWPGFGNDPGILTSGPTVFQSGAFRVDIDGNAAGSGYGRLVTSGLSITSTVVSLQVDLGFEPSPGDVFLIVQNAAGAVNGTFRDLPQSATFHAEGWTWRISYTGGDGNDVTLTAVRRVTADLSIALVASPSPVNPGSALVYTATVTNHGPDTATSVQVFMGTPVGTTFESISGPAGWTCFKLVTSANATCNGPSLASGATATVTFTYRVNSGVTGSISGTGSVSNTVTDPISANNAHIVSTPVGPGGGMAFKLRLPGIAADSAGVNIE